MRKVIRKNLFETNSSAVHTLAISGDGLEPSNLPVDKDGYIITDFGDFGDYDMGMTAYDQATKLSYLATECYYLNHWDIHLDDNWQWEHICEAIKEYTGAKGVKVLGKVEPNLNHQVQPSYDPKFCNPWYDNSVISFIFNKYVGIEMSHD